MKTNINGCYMGAYSRLAKKCRQCMHKEYCQSKRMEHVGYLTPMQQLVTMPNPSIQYMGMKAEDAQEAILKLNKLMIRSAIDIKEGG